MTDGKVYLVGAGPGDDGLITVRGAHLLSLADCVLYDSLANDSLLAHARPGAELISVGKRSGAHSYTQDEINRLIVEKARQGNIVVRLKGGDPCIFGRGAEEARVLADAGIEFEIVPGITAAIAAAEYAGIMLTDREYSSQVLFVTGHEAEGKTASGIDWDLLARFRGSIVFYMGLAALGSITAELTARGADPSLPVCIIESATLPRQRVIRGTLSDISAIAAKAAVSSPALIIVGRAAAGEPRLDWFARRPLRGLRIVATRDEQGNRDFAAKIAALGGIPIAFQSIRFKRLTESDAYIAAFASLSSYDWLIFTSSRGVDAFTESIAGFGKDARVLGGIKVACVGAETAKSLAAFGVKADFVPTVSTGVELAMQLIAAFDVTARRFLLLRSAIAEPALADLLKAAGATVDDVPAYTSQPAGADGTALCAALMAGNIDWVTFTSGSAVRAFLAAVDAGLLGDKAKLASIGPVTSAEMATRGLKVSAEAKVSTIDGILSAIAESEGRL
jgi:uroporphyrinogen III methyltransferase / synthase